MKYGADRYGIDYHEFITRDDVDIVIIATYVSTHLSILRDCVVAGKHVLCEKPIAANARDGQEFYRLAKNGRSQVLVAHILRRNASYIKIRDLIRSGAIGRLKTVRMTQNHHALDWERYRRLLEDCSPILDCGVHYFDVDVYKRQSCSRRWCAAPPFGRNTSSRSPIGTGRYNPIARGSDRPGRARPPRSGRLPPYNTGIPLLRRW